MAVGEGEQDRSTKGGSVCCAGDGGRIVRLREGMEIRVCLGKGFVAMCRRCKERGHVQRNSSLILNGIVLRDHTVVNKAENSFTEGEPELHAQERMVEANGD
jgi:hypothetical protein